MIKRDPVTEGAKSIGRTEVDIDWYIANMPGEPLFLSQDSTLYGDPWRVLEGVNPSTSGDHSEYEIWDICGQCFRMKPSHRFFVQDKDLKRVMSD